MKSTIMIAMIAMIACLTLQSALASENEVNTSKPPILKCQAKIIYGNQLIADSNTNHALKIDLNDIEEGDLVDIDLKNNATLRVIRQLNSSSIKKAYGLTLAYFPTDSDSPETAGVLLLPLKEQNMAHHEVLGLFSGSSLLAKDSTIFPTQKMIAALQSMGEDKIRLPITEKNEHHLFNTLVKNALAKNLIEAKDIVAFGFDSSCTLSEK